MELTNKKTVKELLAKHGAAAEKKLGQHFILSKKALAQMIAAAEIKKNDTIIEVGPGLGTLTQELAKTLPGRQAGGAKIIAIERDSLMLGILRETLKDFKNIKIIEGDACKFSILNFQFSNKTKNSNYKIIANLPYNIATFLIHQWLELKKPPETMILMIQKEVAQRITAKPPRMNLLAVSVQFYAEAKIIDYVPAEAFWPRPKVDSAIIKIVPKKSPPQKTRDTFFIVAKAGFSQPRKQLIGNLVKKLNIPKKRLISIFKDLNISERARAENLSLDQWISLAISLHLTIQRK